LLRAPWAYAAPGPRIHEHESTRFTPALLAGKHFPDDTVEIYAAQKALSRSIIEMRCSQCLGACATSFHPKLTGQIFYHLIVVSQELCVFLG